MKRKKSSIGARIRKGRNAHARARTIKGGKGRIKKRPSYRKAMGLIKKRR